MVGGSGRPSAVVIATGAVFVACLAVVSQPALAAQAVQCMGKPATIVGTNAGETLTGTDGSDVIVGLGGDDVIDGGRGQDWICGGAGADQVVGGPGQGHLSGGAGNDVVIGGNGDDDLRGDAGFDALLAKGGDDRYSGGSGLDIAAFLTASSGVLVDLAAGTARGEGRDSLSGVEAAMGSSHADRLLGTSGLDLLYSGTGADVLDGRGGRKDYILLTNARGGVEIDLRDDTYTGGGRAPGIENVFGSAFDDTIYGDSGLNYLDGGKGHDAVDGIDGTDSCLAEVTVRCIPDETTATKPDVGEPPPPPPGVARHGAPASLDTTPREAGTTHRDGSTSATRPIGARSPAEVLRHALRQLRPVTHGSAAVRRPARKAAVASLICPYLENLARLTINVNGWVFAATKNDLDTGWRYSDWIYLSGNSYWYYNSGTRAYRGPYNRVESYGVVNYQVTTPVYTGIRAYAQVYVSATGRYYAVDPCTGSVGATGGGI